MVTPLPYTDSGTKVAFYTTIGIFVLLGQRIRLRGGLNRHGSSDQHMMRPGRARMGAPSESLLAWRWRGLSQPGLLSRLV